MIKKIVLDFDGVLTDPVIEAGPALAEWSRLFSVTSGMPLDDLLSLEKEIAVRIRADPEAGWEKDGQIIAPATADPYVFHTSLYVELMRELRNTRYTVPEDDDKGMELLHRLFNESYGHQVTAFREGAAEFLQSLQWPTTIVTNSDAAKVVKKLDMLGVHPKGGVVGNAKKYVNDPSAAELPESRSLEGMARPVLLRRKLYKQVLDEIAPLPSVVIGDIFELDLAMPLALGYTGILYRTEGAQEREIAHMLKEPKGYVADSYADILSILTTLGG